MLELNTTLLLMLELNTTPLVRRANLGYSELSRRI